MDTVAVVVRIVSPEMARTVVRHEVTVTRRDPVDVSVVSDPHEIASVLPHDILAGEGVPVVGGQTASGSVADPLGLFPSGVSHRASGGAAPGRG